MFPDLVKPSSQGVAPELSAPVAPTEAFNFSDIMTQARPTPPTELPAELKNIDLTDDFSNIDVDKDSFSQEITPISQTGGELVPRARDAKTIGKFTDLQGYVYDADRPGVKRIMSDDELLVAHKAIKTDKTLSKNERDGLKRAVKRTRGVAKTFMDGTIEGASIVGNVFGLAERVFPEHYANIKNLDIVPPSEAREVMRALLPEVESYAIIGGLFKALRAGTGLLAGEAATGAAGAGKAITGASGVKAAIQKAASKITPKTLKDVAKNSPRAANAIRNIVEAATVGEAVGIAQSAGPGVSVQDTLVSASKTAAAFALFAGATTGLSAWAGRSTRRYIATLDKKVAEETATLLSGGDPNPDALIRILKNAAKADKARGIKVPKEAAKFIKDAEAFVKTPAGYKKVVDGLVSQFGRGSAGPQAAPEFVGQLAGQAQAPPPVVPPAAIAPQGMFPDLVKPQSVTPAPLAPAEAPVIQPEPSILPSEAVAPTITPPEVVTPSAAAQEAVGEATGVSEEVTQEEVQPDLITTDRTPEINQRVAEAVNTDFTQAPPLPPEGTSARIDNILRDREDMGHGPISQWSREETQTWGQVLTEAHAGNMPAQASRLAETIVSQPRPMSAVETGGMVIRMTQLKNEHAEAMKDMAAATDPADIQFKSAEISRIEQDHELISRATALSGTEKGRALNAQKLTLDRNYDLLSVLTRAKAKAQRELRPKERARLEKAVADLKIATERNIELQIRLDNGTAQRSARRGASQYARMSPPARRSSIAQLNATLSEQLLEGCAN